MANTPSQPQGMGALGPPEPSPYPGLDSPPPNRDDPAFQPPQDPLLDQGALRQRVFIIHREIPNVSIQEGWMVSDVRGAIVNLSQGLFDLPSQLLDGIARDSRVQSSMRSRSGGLLGRNIRFKVPKKYEGEPVAQKCQRVWVKHWENMHAEPGLLDLLERSHGIGFSYWQLLWDTGGKRWYPFAQSFDTRYSFYHWDYRVHVAVHRDGITPITPGDGHWVLHAPYGSYRGWMRASLAAVAQWWLARNYALRDWARYSERHGFPIIIADTPFGADPNDIQQYATNLASLGQESVVQVPGSVDVTKYGKYDLRYLEPADENWQAFKALIEQCNDEITLALLGQNLTSQVKEGSFAAARVHADVRQAILEADARALERTLYVQVLRPFAALNFGDPNLAPIPKWDVRPPEDLKVKGETFQAFATGINQLRQGGKAIKNPERFARAFGLRGLDLIDVDPVQVEARVAQATGKTDAPKASGKNPITEALIQSLGEAMAHLPAPELAAFAKRLKQLV
jgi:phage gp29-like protein